MKISYTWLQKYFDTPLPPVEELARAITFNAFEIDGIEHGARDSVLDVKVLPDRTHDCLSYRGVAKEVSAILNLPLSSDPLEKEPELPAGDTVRVSIEEPTLCTRYVAAHLRGVKVGPSPQWLVERLASMGQRSVNTVVDATNFVMFNMGQPLHAFDAGKLVAQDGVYSLGVRKARSGEVLLALDGKEYALTNSMLVIEDTHADVPIGLAGVKGGAPAGITEETVDIILESANFDGVATRKTSRALNLRTDASARFENVISPELAGYGIAAAAELIQKLAGGELVGYCDVYPHKPQQKHVAVSAHDVNRLFGISLSDADVEAILARFGFAYTKTDGVFSVAIPFERLDLLSTEDIVADIGRLFGYDKIPTTLPETTGLIPSVDKRFYYIDRVREWLVGQGFSEVYTSVFTLSGERQVLNKVDSDRPYLRSDIWPSLEVALEMNWKNKELLGLTDIRLFELGVVWTGAAEKMMLVLGTRGDKKTPPASEYLKGLLKEFDSKLPTDVPPTPIVNMDFDSFLVHAPDPLSYQTLPTIGDVAYAPYSKYPYIVRDVAFWADASADPLALQEEIAAAAGDLTARLDLFDRFEKEGRVSYGFRFVFQAADRTLTDTDAAAAMERVYEVLKSKGYELR